MPDLNLSSKRNNRPRVRLTRCGAVAVLGFLVLFLGAIPPTFAQAQEVEAHGPNRRVNVVLLRHFPPQYQLDKNGDPTGFAVDVMDAVAARAGLRLKYVVKDSGSEVVDELLSGRADVIPNVGIAAGREETMAFTAPLETFRVSLFIRDDTIGIASLDDLAGKAVGVVELNVGEKIMADRSDARVTVYPDYPEALFALLAGTIDAFIYPEAAIWHAARDARVDGRIKTAGAPLREVKRAIAVRKDNTVLLALLAPAVDEFLGTQEYRRIYTRWYGDPTPFWSVKRVVIAFGALLIASVTGLFFWRHLSLYRLNGRLQKSEETLSLFQDSATEDFALFDRDLKLLNANAASISRLGEPLERVIGKPLLELLPHLAGTERYDHYRKIARSGGTYDAEIEMSSDDGEIRYRAVSAFRAGDGLGVITRDITERKRAEAALQKSEETLSLFQDSATEDFALFDDDLNLLNANAPALKHLGRPLAQAVGKPLLELMPHLAGTERYARFLEVAKTRDTYDAEVAIARADGEIRYRAVSAFRAGEGLGVITRDITERKRAEQALRESEGRLNAFFAEAPAELVMFDRDLRYLKVNETLARINGLPVGDHIGKPICEIAPDLAPKIEPLFRRILETAEPLLNFELEGEVETDPGIKHTWALSIFPILGGDGTPQGIGSISINITERKRAERELELLNHRLEKLVGERTAELRATQVELLNAERLAALGQLTATVAHELRNPLATIRTSVFSLRSRIQDGAGEAQTTLRRIDRNIVRCDRIISELLDFSANQEPHLETVDLNRCIAAWVEDYEASEGTRLRLAISDGAATVRIDQDRLHQVLVNLLDNASQALEETPGRGRRDAEIAVRTRIEGGRFVLEVADDGPGIPDDVLPRIFEPLFSTKGFGVGLGLPLVKKIIDQHGGDIEVVTGMGDGTTFRVHLPLEQHPFRWNRPIENLEGRSPNG